MEFAKRFWNFTMLTSVGLFELMADGRWIQHEREGTGWKSESRTDAVYVEDAEDWAATKSRNSVC